MSPRIDQLETVRLLLRRFTEADRAPFAAMNTDPHVTEHLAGPMTRADSDAFVDRILAHWDTWGYGPHAVQQQADPDGDMIGYIGLWHHRALPDEVEIGWRLARTAWGRGLATEGAMVVRDAAFDVLELERLVSLTTDENIASRRVMDKLGFRYDRHMPFERWNLRVAILDSPQPQQPPQPPQPQQPADVQEPLPH